MTIDLDVLEGLINDGLAAEERGDLAAMAQNDEDIYRLASPRELLKLIAAARERDGLRDELEEARTLDRGFYEWMIERDLLQRGEEVEWPDIVTALTEHEIALIDAGDSAAKAGNARQALQAGEKG